MKARITLELGNRSGHYVEILGSSHIQKSSKVRIKRKGNSILIDIEASDSKALISSSGAVLRQLHIVNNTMKMMPGRAPGARQDR